MLEKKYGCDSYFFQNIYVVIYILKGKMHYKLLS